MPDLYALWENSLRCFLIQKNASRVEQECETEVQGWNGTVPKGGSKTGGASVGAGQDSGACEAGAREYGAREKGRGAGRRRRAEPRGCVREAGEGKVRAKRRDCSGERGAAGGRALAEGELEHGGEERKDAAGRTTARRKDGGRNRRKDGRSGKLRDCRGTARRRYAGAARGGIGPTAVPGGNIALEQEPPARGRRDSRFLSASAAWSARAGRDS